MTTYSDIIADYIPYTPEMKVDELIYNICVTNTSSNSATTSSSSSLLHEDNSNQESDTIYISSSFRKLSSSSSTTSSVSSDVHVSQPQPLTENQSPPFIKRRHHDRNTNTRDEHMPLTLRITLFPMNNQEIQQYKRLLAALQTINYHQLNLPDHYHVLTLDQAVSYVTDIHANRILNSQVSASSSSMTTENINMFMNFEYDDYEIRTNQKFTMYLHLYNQNNDYHHRQDSSDTDSTHKSHQNGKMRVTNTHPECSSLMQHISLFFSRLSVTHWVTHQHQLVTHNRWSKGICQTGTPCVYLLIILYLLFSSVMPYPSVVTSYTVLRMCISVSSINNIITYYYYYYYYYILLMST